MIHKIKWYAVEGDEIAVLVLIAEVLMVMSRQLEIITVEFFDPRLLDPLHVYMLCTVLLIERIDL